MNYHKSGTHVVSFSPDANFKKHYRTLVSRGMPLNKHINREKQSTCHTLTNTRRDRNAKNLLIEKNPAGENTTGVDVQCNITGSIPRLSFYNWFSDCFQWLMSIRDAFRAKNRLHSDPVKKKHDLNSHINGRMLRSHISLAGI